LSVATSTRALIVQAPPQSLQHPTELCEGRFLCHAQSLPGRLRVQGNESRLTSPRPQYFQQVFGIPSGAFAASLDGSLVGGLAHQIEGEVADHGHVLGIRCLPSRSSFAYSTPGNRIHFPNPTPTVGRDGGFLRWCCRHHSVLVSNGFTQSDGIAGNVPFAKAAYQAFAKPERRSKVQARLPDVERDALDNYRRQN
jgi:hypothetical protein